MSPFVARCKDCSHVWAPLFFPCSPEELGKIVDRIACPKCGGKDHLADTSIKNDLLTRVVDHALDAGAFDGDTPLWREVAITCGLDQETGNRLPEEKDIKDAR